MASDTKLDEERDALRKQFEAQEDKTVPAIQASVIEGEPEGTFDSLFGEVRRLHAQGKAAIVFVGAIAAPSSVADGDTSEADGYLELVSQKLTPRELLVFSHGNLPARLADHLYTVVKQAIESQILNLAAEIGDTPEKGN